MMILITFRVHFKEKGWYGRILVHVKVICNTDLVPRLHLQGLSSRDWGFYYPSWDLWKVADSRREASQFNDCKVMHDSL